nr:hypothetical protein [Myxococcota bacterium]
MSNERPGAGVELAVGRGSVVFVTELDGFVTAGVAVGSLRSGALRTNKITAQATTPNRAPAKNHLPAPSSNRAGLGLARLAVSRGRGRTGRAGPLES